MTAKCCPVCRQAWPRYYPSPVLARLEQIGDEYEPVRTAGTDPRYIHKLTARYPGWVFRQETRHTLFGVVYDIEARRR